MVSMSMSSSAWKTSSPVKALRCGSVAWVLTAFMLSSAVTTPIAGKLGDLLGYRRVLVACLLCFTAGTVVAALGAGAHSLAALIVGRAVQGVSGGVFPLAFGIVRAAVPPSRIPGVVALLVPVALVMLVAIPVASPASATEKAPEPASR